MGKSSCSDKNGLKKGPWAADEDQKLVDYIQKHGHGRWRTLPKNAGLKRCGKSCRLRWTNYLRPDIKRGKFSVEEEETIMQLRRALGNKWSTIAAHLPGRTDNEIKNYWNTHIKKKLIRMGIDPVTHSPRLDLLRLSSILSSSQLDASNFLGPRSLLHPEFLNLATTLLSCQSRTGGFSPQDLLSCQSRTGGFSPQDNQNQSQSFQENLIQLPVQACTEPMDESSAQFLDETQLMQANLEQIYSDPTNFSWQNFLPNLSQDDVKSFNMSKRAIFIPSYGYENTCQSRTDPLSQNQALFSQINGGNIPKMTFGSLLTAPSSSSTPLNSSSTHYVNGSTEDERDSYCSNMLFDSLDAIGLVENICHI